MNRLLLAPLLLAALAAGCRDAEANRSAEAQSFAHVGQATVPALPALTGRVVDGANILSERTERDVGARLAALEAKTSDQLVVVTVPSLGGESIEDFGRRLGNGWGVGRKDFDNGVLLIVATGERKIRIAVGNGLEGLLTDARAQQIIEAMPRSFRAGDFDTGVKTGVDEIVRTLESESKRPMPLDLSKVA